MWNARVRDSFALLACLIVVGQPVSADAQSVIWSNPWTVQVAPWVPPTGFVATGAPAFVTTAIAADGDVLVGGESYNQDFRVDRVTSNGSIRWSTHIPNVFYDWSGVGAMLPTADGGAFVTVGNPKYTFNTLFVRIGPDGSIVWESEESAWTLAMPTQQTVVSAGYGAITDFDAVTGAALWQYASNGVLPSSVASDGTGNVFAEIANGSGVDAVDLDSSGHVLWQVTVDDTTTPAAEPVQVSSGRVFVNTSTGMLALNASDGSTAWSAQQSTVVAMAGSPTDPIVAGNGVIQRLAAADGHAVWTQTFSGSVSFANFTDGEVLIGSGNTFTALSPDTGSTLWSTTIPAQDGNGHSLHLVAAGTDGGSNISAVASAGYGQPVFLQPINSQTGQLETPIAVTARTPEGIYAANSVEEGNGDIASVGLNWGAGSAEIRLRRLDGVTGATLWETAQPLDGFSTPAIPTIASGNGTIVVAVAENQGVYNDPNSHGFTWVGVFDDQTGNLRWQRSLQDQGQESAYQPDPAVVLDAQGNIYLSYGANVSCATYQDPSCTDSEQVLMKLAAADGSTLWRFDDVGIGGSLFQAPLNFILSGTDVVVSGPFSGTLASHDAVDLSGANGSLIWTSDAFGGNGQGDFFASLDGSLIGLGSNSWVRADAGTGSVIWANSRVPAPPCSVDCVIYDQLIAPNGDIFRVGEAQFMPIIDYMPGVQNGIEKFWLLNSIYPMLRSIVDRVDADASGRIWIQLNRFIHHGAWGINFLAQLDPSTGSLLSQQAITGFEHFPFPERIDSAFLTAPEDDRLPVYTFDVGPPESSTPGMALIDTTVTATGNLSIHVTTDHAVAHPGDTVGFHIVAAYSGSAPIVGAHVIADLSGLGIPYGLTCATQAATNCALDSSLDQVTASFDIQPGGQIEISGQVSVSQAPGNLMLPAIVYGPTGLSEQDTLDNFATLSMTDEIFANGF